MRELNGIGREIQHNLSQAGRIAYEVRRLVAVVVDGERQGFAFGAMRECAQHVVERRFEIERNPFKLEATGFDLGEIKDIVGDVK